MGIYIHTELFLGAGYFVPVLLWQGTGRDRLHWWGDSARAWAGWGDTLLQILHAGSGRTGCAGGAAKHSCEQGEGAEPCLKIDLHWISNAMSKCYKLVTSFKSQVKMSSLVRAPRWCVPGEGVQQSHLWWSTAMQVTIKCNSLHKGGLLTWARERTGNALPQGCKVIFHFSSVFSPQEAASN